ncbi:MAG: hypothetical protein KBD53_09175 [Candidatus Omnitrophica bacterium]|nr:hypothetical protein [Candidatus Omnitrophota bacterium]
MKDISKIVKLTLSSFFLLFCLHTSLPAHAQEDEAVEPPTLLGGYLKDLGVEITGGGTLDYFNRYVWRGQYLDRDSVLQPGFSFSTKGFTVGYWGSFDVESKDALTSDESDYYMSYAYTLEPVTVSAGHTWYDFPEYNTSSKEFFVSAAVATLLTPTVAFYHDYEDGESLNTDGDGNYYTLAVSHKILVCQKTGTAVDLGLTLGYVDGQWLSGEGMHLTPTAGLNLALTPNLNVIPTVGYNLPMGDLEDENIGNQEDKIFGGVKMAYTF